MPEQNSHIFDRITERARALGFGDFGCAGAGRLDRDQDFYNQAMEAGHFAEMTYLIRNTDKRLDPRLLVEGAKSVLCFLAPYGKNNFSVPTAGSLKISSYALGEDYHKVIKDKLYILLQEIREMAPGTQGRVFVDSAPVLERAWATRAGLGFIGKNNFLISRRCGIRHFIGIIITDLELPCTRAEEKNYCGTCTRCLDSCPSGALCAPFTLDTRKCISYQTIESRLPAQQEPEQVFRDGWIFGCDACLNACPWNRKNIPGWEEFTTREKELAATGPLEWMQMTPEFFAARFRDSPLSRAGLAKIKDSVQTCLCRKEGWATAGSLPEAGEEKEKTRPM